MIPPTKFDFEPEMIFVKGGTFTMGCTSEQSSDCSEDEKPAHKVTLSDFNISKYEVTQDEWQSVMGSNPSQFKGDKLPVERVSWENVQTYLKKLNSKTGKKYRLPTEAEWKYAAKGGDKSKNYEYSGSNILNEVAWNKDNSGGETHEVGAKKANELGIYDMSGNIWEWCSDWFDGVDSVSPTNNPTGPSSGSSHVLRGGSWGDDSRGCRVVGLNFNTPTNRNTYIGFRVVISLQ